MAPVPRPNHVEPREVRTVQPPRRPSAQPVRPEARFRRIERKRNILLEEVESLDPGALHAHPRPGKWSIHEIVEHLVVAEEDVVIDYRNLHGLEARPRTLKNRLTYLIVMLVLRFDIPVQAPSEAMLPRGDLSLRALRVRWELNHVRMRAYLDGLDRAKSRRAIFRHPVSGPLTVPQALAMLEAHLDRHIRQIRTLQRMHADAAAQSASLGTPDPS